MVRGAGAFHRPRSTRSDQATARYALAGIAKCAHCGGAILSSRTRVYGGGAERVKVYACSRHHQRGSSVCPVTVYQRMDEVEGALVDYVSRHVLTERVLDEVLSEIREQIAAQLPKRDADVADLETELRGVRAEQKRLAKAVALADDVPELVTELRQRSARIQHLEAQIRTAKQTPDELAKLVKQIETSSRAKLADLRAALADESDRREAFLALFPDGLTFAPVRTPNGERQVWQITGDIDLGSLTDASGSKRITTRSPANDGGSPEPTTEITSDGGSGSKRAATPTGFEPVSRLAA